MKKCINLPIGHTPGVGKGANGLFPKVPDVDTLADSFPDAFSIDFPQLVWFTGSLGERFQ